jgi:hypothetical protein
MKYGINYGIFKTHIDDEIVIQKLTGKTEERN